MPDPVIFFEHFFFIFLLPMERVDEAAGHVLAAKERFGAGSCCENLAGTPEQMAFARRFLEATIQPAGQEKGFHNPVY